MTVMVCICCCCRYGEIESRWVAMESWTFSTVISAEDVDALLQQQQVLLQLDGVDTYADVFINDQDVLKTTNFHRSVPAPANTTYNSSTTQQMHSCKSPQQCRADS